ncbi:MAG: spore coat protein [Bacillota bacterium]
MQLTSKEKTLITDNLTAEEICDQKYKYYAENASDQEIRSLFSDLAAEEDRHIQMLNDALNGNFDMEAAGGRSSSGQSSRKEGNSDIKMTNKNSDMEIANSAMSAKNTQKVDGLTDRQLLQDALMTIKHLSGNYDNSILETANREVFQTFEQLQRDKHNHKQEIFELMNQKGWYSVSPAQ